MHTVEPHAREQGPPSLEPCETGLRHISSEALATLARGDMGRNHHYMRKRPGVLLGLFNIPS